MLRLIQQTQCMQFRQIGAGGLIHHIMRAPMGVDPVAFAGVAQGAPWQGFADPLLARRPGKG